MVDVSVVIPVRNDASRLRTCVEALGRQATDLAYEVIVVDNGSSDDVAGAVASSPLARIVSEPVPGSYRARNAGAAVATGGVLAFTDSDCIPDLHWIERGHDALAEQTAPTIIAGHVELFTRDAARPTIAETWDLVNAFPQRRYVEQSNFGVTANLFVRASLWRDLGGFDGSLLSNGDRDFGRRAHAAGVACAFEPSAVVRHPCRTSVPEIGRKLARLIEGDVAFRRIHDAGQWSAREWARAVVPPLRSELRKAATVPAGATRRAQYVGVATGLHYYALAQRGASVWRSRQHA